MAVVDTVLHVHRTGDGRQLQFELFAPDVRNAVWEFLNRALPKHNDYVRVTLDVPMKKIKVGPRGQLNRHWGHCQDIAEQLDSNEHSVTPRMVDEFLRIEAVREGFPTFYNVLRDSVEPVHFDSALSVEHANIVELVKQRFCDKRDLWLTEYDKTSTPIQPYKAVAGRTRGEMEVYWHEQTERATQG